MSDSHTRDGLSVYLLGGMELWRDGQPAARPLYDKGRALLAYLAAESARPHPREQLAAMLWPDLPSAAARTNLRQVVMNLRRTLGDACLQADRDSIRMIVDGQIRLDVAELLAPAPVCVAERPREHCAHCVAQMERMAALYRGEFMAGFSLPECFEFEDWLQIKREMLHRHALAVLERLSDCLEQAGAPARALPHAVRFTELEPWNEEARRRVMRLYVQNGQTAAALGQYEAYCRVLETELGVRPDEETQRLAAHIRGGAQAQSAEISAGRAPVPALPAPLGRRRQVTVLYCELTPFGTDDPEDAMALLRAPQERCIELVKNGGGHIVQRHGGSLLAYFGFPVAHEYAALQAVRAGLAAARESVAGLDVRVGVHTGIVVTSDDPLVPDTIGTTSALAIQARQGAEAGDVVVSADTLRLVGGYFDCEARGAVTSQRRVGPLELHRIVCESGATTRIEARLRHGGRLARLSPLVGRQSELDALTLAWDRVRRNRRSATLLVQGEAGIGKSRLLLAFKERLMGTRYRYLAMRCFPEFSHTPFHPVIVLFESLLGIAAADAQPARAEKMSAYLADHGAAAAELALAQLLSVGNGDGTGPSRPSAQAGRDETLAALIERIGAAARDQPVLLVVEDIHWADSSTLELLGLLAAKPRKLPILALLTARAGFVLPWRAPPTATLALPPLGDAEIASLVKSLAADVAPARLRSIVAHADGVPLFAEEMARMALADDGAAIPATLHDLLAARLDGMGQARLTAELAATIGRRFGFKLLCAISPFDPATVQRTLTELRAAGLVQGDGAVLQFRHALMREVAYQSQLQADREAAHRRIARALLKESRESPEAPPELVAHHLALGGEPTLAIEYWIKAGQRAFRQCANVEAKAHFDAGLRLVPAVSDLPQRRSLEFALQSALGNLLHAMQGYGSAEAAAAFAHALALSGPPEVEAPALFDAHWGRWVSSLHHFPTALDLARELRRLARQSEDSSRHARAAHAMGASLFWTGDFGGARASMEQSIALCRQEQRCECIDRYGEDFAVTSRAYLSWALWFEGSPERALRTSDEALALARDNGYPHSLGYALVFAAILRCWMRLDGEALKLADEAVELGAQHDLPLWRTAGELARGWALTVQGDPDGISGILRTIPAIRQAMEGVVIVFLGLLADACVHAGRHESALTFVAEAWREMERSGDGHFAAELHRIEGECLLALARDDEAERRFDQAIKVSRRQKARILELRAASSLALLRHRQGRPGEGRRLLEHVYAEFTEGFGIADLVAARELLHSLA